MSESITGTARVGRKTKDLVKRMQAGEIAVIDHDDIDEVSAESLVRVKPAAVVNAGRSITGKYPTPGPGILLKAGVRVLDGVGKEIMDILPDGDEIEITVDGKVLAGGCEVGRGTWLTEEGLEEALERTRENLPELLEAFIQNTLDYAMKEKALVLGGYAVPEILTEIEGRHVLVVVRGHDYLSDLAAVESYIAEVRPVIMAVDGAADALLERGWIPDMIIGDMDSVTDEALRCGAELVVHAYPDGRAPGMDRLRRLGLSAAVFAAPGTSEDIAMLLAYEKGASLIVAVGSHSSMIDFLEKGRPGMASTFLTRLKVGEILVDAKGVSRLYRGKVRPSHFLQMAAGAVIPVAVLVAVSDSLGQYLRLVMMKLRVLLGLLP